MDISKALANSPEPWTSYNALLNLYDRKEDDDQVVAARRDMLAHPNVIGLIKELQDWPGKVVSSHKSAGQHYHKLSFLADIGIKASDPGVGIIFERILQHTSDEGPMRLPMTIADQYGGSGRPIEAWAACDAPITLYALAKMGIKHDPRVVKGTEFMIGLAKENGWGCSVSKELGSFRGPGKKEDPCPYVNLIMLKLLSQYEEHRMGPQALKAVECLLNLWEHSLDRHPYIFYMGNDFRKLKAPFIWYDLLHVLEALSHYPAAMKDPRFSDMLAVLDTKPHQDGLYRPESVWKTWKDWDFGSTKAKSSWMSYLVAMIWKRVS